MIQAGILAGVAGTLLVVAARTWPTATELVYESVLQPWVVRPLAAIGSITPVAVGEIGFALALLLMIRAGGIGWKSTIGGRRTHRFIFTGLKVASVLGWIWLWSVVAFTVTYGRPAPEDLFTLAPMPGQAASEAFVDQVGRRLDELRSTLNQDSEGVVEMPDLTRTLDRSLATDQKDLLDGYRLPSITTGRTKVLASSFVMKRYITGIYLFAFGEPALVLPPYPALLPATVAHERAHLSGFAGEDEASFVSFLTTVRSDRADVRYSGWLSLWLSIGRSPDGRANGVLRDLSAISRHYRQVSGPDTEVFRSAQDAALKSVGEDDGVASYDRVTELALRWFAANGFPADAGYP